MTYHYHLADYYGLLREAFISGEEVDMFDVDSTKPKSVKQFAKLCKEEKRAQLRLIRFVKKHMAEIKADLNDD